MRLLTVTIFWLVSNLALGQILLEKHWEKFKPRQIGPAGMSGRVTAIDVITNKPNHLYIGTASGGLWVSKNGGINWQPIFDEQKVQSIGAVSIQQSNPDVIWVGTGEGNPRNSQTSGYGIYKSIDGGKTWKCMGLEQTRTIHRIIINRQNPNIVWVAAHGSAWGPTNERGVYKTTDGGKTWRNVLFTNNLSGCAELVVDPENPNKLMAAMWEYQRWPYFFKSGGKGSGLYVSFDGGENWEQRTEKDGLPKGELGRIGLAIAPSKPTRVYALIESKDLALYRSEDGGFSWKKISDNNVGNRPFYYNEIYVDPKNENRVFTLFSLVNKSEDGGKTFETLMPYYGYHPDHHAFYIHPENPNYIINGNDGGLNISRDGGVNWQFIENLPLAQFYHINIDNDLPYNIYGGMQDNGSWVGPAYVWRHDGIRNTYWDEVMFGDGFDVLPDPENNRFGYAMYQGGNVSRYDQETGQSHSIVPVHPNGLPLRFNWNAAIAQDPFNPGGIYFGSQYLHYSTNKGNSWQIISPDLTTNDTTKQKQAKSGGLTIDATNAENYTTIISIAPSKQNNKTIWVGTDDGLVQLTQDGGLTWKNVTPAIKGLPKNAWIPQIEVSPHNNGDAYVVANNYRQNDWKPYIFYTSDFGKSWKNLVTENQVFGFCNAIIQDMVEPNLLFLGTEHGLYVSFDKGLNWEKWFKGFPNVSITDLKIHPREHDLIVATFGRAIYVFDNISPLREIAKTKAEVLKSNFKVFNSTTAYLAHYKTAAGIRFAADAVFKGQNKPSGAMISYWWLQNSHPKTNTTSAIKPEKGNKIKVYIFNNQGDTIRNFTTTADTGFNRFYWNLRANGVHYPSYNNPKPGADLPSGMEVLPGLYKVVLVAGSQKDSVSIEVKPDPRLAVNISDLRLKQIMGNAYYERLKLAQQAVYQLNDAKEKINLVNAQLILLPDSTQQKIKKLGKQLNDSIDTYHHLFFTPKDFKGYDHVTKRIMWHFGQVANYVFDTPDAPSLQADVALTHLDANLLNAFNRINKFFLTNWPSYIKAVDEANPKVLKLYDSINLPSR